MGAKAAGDDGSPIADINIVPLVDIILVVLIIFMVTAPALIKPSVKVQLPESASSDETLPSLLNVAITADGEVLLNNEVVDQDSAQRIAKEEFERNPEIQAVVVADRDVDYGLVIQVMDWIKQSGVKNFAMTTDRKVN